eukprot:10574175-Prorocentrum_lima.AAC.1
MTSSLVGSEMCIRDRLHTPPALSAMALQRRGAGLIVCHLRYAPFYLRGCLLYTSDAADDM